MLVLALDALLVFVIGLAGGMALLLSLAIAGWVYFPLRQWLMGLLGRSDQRPLDSTLRQLVNNLFAADSEARSIYRQPEPVCSRPAGVRRLPRTGSRRLTRRGARLGAPPVQERRHDSNPCRVSLPRVQRGSTGR